MSKIFVELKTQSQTYKLPVKKLSFGANVIDF